MIFKTRVEPKVSGDQTKVNRLRTRDYPVQADTREEAERKAIEEYLHEVRNDILATAWEDRLVD